jgi:hypothetical protein
LREDRTIPLLGGVPLCGEEGAFQFFLVILKKIKKFEKKMRSSRLLNTKPQDDACGVK